MFQRWCRRSFCFSRRPRRVWGVRNLYLHEWQHPHSHATPCRKPRPRASYKDGDTAAEWWEQRRSDGDAALQGWVCRKVTSRLPLFSARALISPTIRLLSTPHKAPLLPRLAAINLSSVHIYLHKVATRKGRRARNPGVGSPSNPSCPLVRSVMRVLESALCVCMCVWLRGGK